jgi:hypothetical protein
LTATPNQSGGKSWESRGICPGFLRFRAYFYQAQLGFVVPASQLLKIHGNFWGASGGESCVYI